MIGFFKGPTVQMKKAHYQFQFILYSASEYIIKKTHTFLNKEGPVPVSPPMADSNSSDLDFEQSEN